MNTSHRFSRDQLLLLREKSCCCLKRPVRRRLFYYKLLVECRQRSVEFKQKGSCELPSESSSIPVRITRRPDSTPSFSLRINRGSCLRRIRFESAPRLPKYKFPTFLFSNVRSLFNKMDSVSRVLHQHNVNIGFFAETWLNDELPDACVAVDGYQILRKDRKGRSGGGLICYYDPCLIPSVLTEQEVNSIDVCDSECLPVLFCGLSLLVIACYHPFWNNPDQHESAIECMVDIIDYTVVHEDYPSYCAYCCCLLYTSPSPRDLSTSRMPSSA